MQIDVSKANDADDLEVEGGVILVSGGNRIYCYSFCWPLFNNNNYNVIYSPPLLQRCVFCHAIYCIANP